MAIADLKNVLKIFGGSDLSEGEQDELRKEVLLMGIGREMHEGENELHRSKHDRIHRY